MTPRPDPARRAACGAAAALFALGACRASPRYEPPAWAQRLESETRFVSARLAEPRSAVYSLIEGRYRHVDDQPLWARGRREYVVATHALGVLDLESGAGRVLVQEIRERPGDGNGRFEVVDARGAHALVQRGRRTEDGTLIDPGGWFLLDLEAAALERFDPVVDLKTFDAELKGDPRLLDGAGTLLYEARPRNPLARLPRPSRWIARGRDGALVDLGAGRFLGESQGRAYVVRPDGGGLEFDPSTRSLREIARIELADLADELAATRLAAALELSDDGRSLVWRDPTAGERVIDVGGVAR